MGFEAEETGRMWSTCERGTAPASMPSAMTADVDVDVDVDNEGQQHPLKDALAHFPLAFSTPPCKHLLACLLAEEWAALGDYVVAGVDHAAVGDNVDGCAPETLAGIVAGVL
ncbi:hypothetical protein SCUCBS95973_003771 [Sporothrix curviconia]|uniref:Uncharacterized protein n=1 Tax=Sporothrix curviconia TaxID=1260050 RepID=A0ABP0BI46_9PEZI